MHGLIRRASTFNTVADRPPLRRPARPRRQAVPALRRPERRRAAGHPARPRSSPTRSTTSPRSRTCASRSTSPSTPATRRASGTIRLLEAVRLSGIDTRFYQASSLGDVRRDPAAAERGDAVLPALAVRRRQGLQLLDHPELPRGLRHVRGQRHPVQPRVAAPRRDLRDAQDHPRRRRASRPARRRARLPRQPRRRSATGATPPSTSRACGGCCRPTSPTTTCSPPGGDFTVRDFLADRVRARGPRLGGPRPLRRALPAAHRGRRAGRRRRRRPRRSSAGRRRSTPPSWRGSWSTPTSRRSSTRARPWIDKVRLRELGVPDEPRRRRSPPARSTALDRVLRRRPPRPGRLGDLAQARGRGLHRPGRAHARPNST